MLLILETRAEMKTRTHTQPTQDFIFYYSVFSRCLSARFFPDFTSRLRRRDASLSVPARKPYPPPSHDAFVFPFPSRVRERDREISLDVHM